MIRRFRCNKCDDTGKVIVRMGVAAGVCFYTAPCECNKG